MPLQYFLIALGWCYIHTYQCPYINTGNTTLECVVRVFVEITSQRSTDSEKSRLSDYDFKIEPDDARQLHKGFNVRWQGQYFQTGVVAIRTRA
jgi:hypothetical protein